MRTRLRLLLETLSVTILLLRLVMMPLSRVILTARERHLLLHVLILQSSSRAFDQINVTLEIMDWSDQGVMKIYWIALKPGKARAYKVVKTLCVKGITFKIEPY